ncbi:MAG: cell division protein [Hyphomicrobium sp.]|nr:MAG: cell division protein [Hyphomicrobium sp.]
MSGSYDRFSGRPPQALPAPSYDPYDDPVTGVPPTASAYTADYNSPNYAAAPVTSGRGAGLSISDETTREVYAPSRNDQDHSRKMKTTAPVVPPGSVTGRSLTLVIAIMCFLACLTAGAVWMIKQSADAWLKDIASEVTVQVEPKEKVDIETSVSEVVTFLQKQPGIVSAKPLSLDASSELLQPWLGSSEALKSLPVPRLIAIEVDRSSPPDLTEVGTVLSRDFKGVTLDDHRRWQQQIRAVTGSFALGGLAILALVAAATTAIIVSATKSSMASNREIVEVLHFVGATDKFIAREFEKHFLRLGIKAGIVGAGCAMAVFLVSPAMMELLGGGSVSAVEMQRLIGTGALDPGGYILLGLVVAIIAALCMITSRVGVYRILNGKH